MKTFLTIEPVVDFNLIKLVEIVRLCHPEWVNIGADSGGHGLPDPTAEKVLELISELRKFTEVKPKKNLRRILGRAWAEVPETK